MRLQKYLASCGVASRRKSEELIAQGRVAVNGQVITEMGFKVDVQKDEVTFDGKLIRQEEEKVYILLNKPVEYITTVKDQFDRPSVLDFFKDLDQRIYPVGRLDYNTSGMLILTNDGDFTNLITHPKYHIRKTYLLTVKGHVTAQAVNRLREGVDIGGYVTRPADVEVLEKKGTRTKLRITIGEGKNRQVRRMMDAVDHPVMTLKRVSIGKLTVDDLKPGKWRYMTEEEIRYLRNLATKGE